MANELVSKGPQTGSYRVPCGDDTGWKGSVSLPRDGRRVSFYSLARRVLESSSQVTVVKGTQDPEPDVPWWKTPLGPGNHAGQRIEEAAIGSPRQARLQPLDSRTLI